MKNFAIGCIVVVILLTVVAALNCIQGSQAAIIGASGFLALLLALCFYVLCDIRTLMQRGNKLAD